MILTRDYLSRLSRRSEYESADDYRQRVADDNHRIFQNKSNFDLFLSHSFLDREEVANLIALFNGCGYSVYVDWAYDSQLSRNAVTKETARVLRQRMNQSKGLAYIATGNSTNSKIENGYVYVVDWDDFKKYPNADISYAYERKDSTPSYKVVKSL